MKKKLADELLPSEPTSATIDPEQLVILLIAEPKWGKTAFFMSNPNALLLAFEAGHTFQRGHKLVIDKWGGKHEPKKDREGVNHVTAENALDILEATDKFKFVILDTIDMATKMAADYAIAKKGGRVEHISELGDYGKGYDVAQNTPIRQFIMRLLKTGRGVGLIAHSKVEIQRNTSGERARKECRLPSGVRYICESQADAILHGEFGKKQKGNNYRDRILVCEGDADTLAGNRSDARLPDRYIVRKGKQWAQFAKFFANPEAAAREEKRYRMALRGK